MYSPIESPTWNYIAGNCTNTPISPDGTPDPETTRIDLHPSTYMDKFNRLQLPVPCRVYVDESGVDGVATTVVMSIRRVFAG
jgi:hypothetical protein